MQDYLPADVYFRSSIFQPASLFRRFCNMFRCCLGPCDSLAMLKYIITIYSGSLKIFNPLDGTFYILINMLQHSTMLGTR